VSTISYFVCPLMDYNVSSVTVLALFDSVCVYKKKCSPKGEAYIVAALSVCPSVQYLVREITLKLDSECVYNLIVSVSTI